MKIEIEIPDSVVLTIGCWASISRTLDAAEKWALLVNETVDDNDVSGDAFYCLKELKQIHAPVSDLCTLVRTEIWKQTSPQVTLILENYKGGTFSREQAQGMLRKIPVYDWKACEWLRDVDAAKLKADQP